MIGCPETLVTISKRCRTSQKSKDFMLYIPTYTQCVHAVCKDKHTFSVFHCSLNAETMNYTSCTDNFEKNYTHCLKLNAAISRNSSRVTEQQFETLSKGLLVHHSILPPQYAHGESCQVPWTFSHHLSSSRRRR